MDRASGTHGTISKGLTFTSLKSQKRGGKNWGQKVFEEIIAEKSQIWGKIYIHVQFQQDKQIPNRLNAKKNLPRHVTNNLLKTNKQTNRNKDNEKILKAA